MPIFGDDRGDEELAMRGLDRGEEDEGPRRGEDRREEEEAAWGWG